MDTKKAHNENMLLVVVLMLLLLPHYSTQDGKLYVSCMAFSLHACLPTQGSWVHYFMAECFSFTTLLVILFIYLHKMFLFLVVTTKEMG